MEEIACPVCGVVQWPSDDCIACGHPLGADEGPASGGPDEAMVAGFDADELDDIVLEDDDRAGDGPH